MRRHVLRPSVDHRPNERLRGEPPCLLATNLYTRPGPPFRPNDPRNRRVAPRADDRLL